MQIDDGEIQRIVKKVVGQVMGLEKPAAAPSAPQPAPANASGSSTAPKPETLPKPAPPPSGKKVVAIGADHGGYDMKELLKPEVTGMGYEVVDVGTTNSKDSVDYPDFALEVALLVSGGKAWRGILIDGAGIGSCIAANKVPGVRAGMAYDYTTAVNGREHNDANVLTLGAGLIGPALAKQIVKTWLSTEFGGGRHAKRVDKIIAIEKKYLK